MLQYLLKLHQDTHTRRSEITYGKTFLFLFFNLIILFLVKYGLVMTKIFLMNTLKYTYNLLLFCLPLDLRVLASAHTNCRRLSQTDTIDLGT